MSGSDDDNAYRTDEDMVGRSIRRGTKKGLGAVGAAAIGGALGGPVGAFLGAALTHLLSDAVVESLDAIDRSDT